jgi:two-component system cell cycle sensor histidine kinase/response regulator CckA
MEAMQTATKNADSKETILWVDDEEIALKVWSLMLQKLGYTVLQARHGYEALELFEDNKNRISLVILDMRMPGMNGCEVYDRLKEIQPETKIIIASGYIDQYSIEELSKRDFNGYIEKPFKLKELSDKIEDVLVQP